MGTITYKKQNAAHTALEGKKVIAVTVDAGREWGDDAMAVIWGEK